MGRSKKSWNPFGFFILVFITIIRELEARELQQTASVCSSSCGDIRNISSPFRLKGDPPGCGDHHYELTCHNNHTILQLTSSGKYLVKKIWYDQRKISVVDYNLANETCVLPSGSLTVDSQLTNYDIARDGGYTNAHFVRCLDEISNFKDSIPIPCLNQNGWHAYVHLGGSSIFSISDLPNSCVFLSTVPTITTNVKSSYQYNMLQMGFNLSWSLQCRDCRLAGGFCSMEINEGLCRIQSPLFRVILVAMFLLVANIVLIRLRFLFTTVSVYIFPLWIFTGFSQSGSLYDPYPTWLFERILTLFRHFNWLKQNSLLISIVSEFNVIVNIAVIVIQVIFTVALIGFLIHKCINDRKTADIVEKFLYTQQLLMPRRYNYVEIIAITGNFSDKLGQGGFGSVYKGKLFDGTLVAVKVLQSSNFSGEEFINEISTIGRIHHSNVVILLGFCSEGSKRALIYEYMPNGSLDKHIFSKKNGDRSFSWQKLHQIALGTARGIEYLHNGCDVCILHFDIKPHNILLDASFNPKVADFGLAKFHPKENNFICMSATRGTIGYIAPELISRNFGVVSNKSDVYGFGMLLLEMAGGRKNSFAMASRSSKAYFPSWVYDQITEGRKLEFQNPSEIEEVIARKLCIVGLWCIQVNPTTRPSITKVVEMLETDIHDLQMPPKPFFSSSSATEFSSSSQQNSFEEMQIDYSSSEWYQYSESMEG